MTDVDRHLAASVAGSLAFLALARVAARGTVTAGEERVFRAVNRLSPALRAPAWVVMQAGSLPAVAVAAGAALPKQRRTAVALAVDGVAVWAACKLIKRVVRRGRPADHLDGVSIHGLAQRGGGFPSGHAAVATTLASIGGRVLPKAWIRPTWGVAALVCVTRQYVGAHLPLDVLGGAALGLCAGGLANLALDAGQRS